MQGNVLVYTRKPQGEYTQSLAASVHIACRRGDGAFAPLNQNYGMLFAEATLFDNNTICEKGLRSPYIFRASDGELGIIATRVTADGEDDEECGSTVLLWTTPDLIDFTYHGLVDMSDKRIKGTAAEEYGAAAECGAAAEYGAATECGAASLNSCPQAADDEKTPDGAKPGDAADAIAVDAKDIPNGANPGNAIAVEPQIAQAAYDYWAPPRHVKTEVQSDATISSLDELDKIRATAIYSDGSVASKQVKWDTGGIDITRPGTYEVSGKATTPKYPFPLARGYADPVILPLDGNYYFIATNDNLNDIGLYARESKTIEGLFAPGYEEVCILDVDEEKGFIQTFWAPEFHFIGDDLYILFAVGGKQWGPQCHMMKLRKNGSITNAKDWETPVRVTRKDGSPLTADGITLDMTYFKADGKSFVAWSYRYGIGTPNDTGSMIYIASIDEKYPSALTSEPVLLTRPLLGWENLQGTINNEGPYPLITDDTVYLAYSGGAARGYTYSIGLLSIPRGSDYLDAAKWKKAQAPLVNYTSLPGLYGAGHNSFFQDFDGNVMLAYHAEEEIIPHGVAMSAMHRVHFRRDGSPVFNMSPDRDLSDKLVDVKLKVMVLPK